MKSIIALITIVLSVTTCRADTGVQGPYFGQESPGLKVQRFAPGLISLDDRYEHTLIFSPDGQECYFSVSTENWSSCWIMMTKLDKGSWTPAQKAPFSNNRSLNPSISPDGTRLFFSSDRGTAGKQGIWQCRRTRENGWSDPEEMNRQISSTAADWSCHLSDLGNMYTCSWRSGGVGGCDGWRITDIEGTSPVAENLRALNTSTNDCGVAPGPKERYVVFQSNRPGGQGKGDLYISYTLANGQWSEPRNLGPAINSPEVDGGAWITYDGKYLFFSSRRSGNQDIYWIETQAFLKDPNDPEANQTDLGVRITGSSAEPFARGPYLGQTPPGPVAQVFAPGLICDTRPHRHETHGHFSADGNTFCFRRLGISRFYLRVTSR